jgi:hypothetical protein
MWRSNPAWGSPRIIGELRKLGSNMAKSTVEKYRLRLRKSPSPTWKTFLENYVQDLVALDFCVVPTATYKVLFVLLILAHHRRRVVHVNIVAWRQTTMPLGQLAIVLRPAHAHTFLEDG